MSRYTALLNKARRRAHPAFSAPAETLEQRETKRRLKAEDEGSLYLPSKAWLLEPAARQTSPQPPVAE
ncbi:hypothetical protein [Comamonas sp. CMM02]|uniref:hypothetical protein n=1 Tax=Comamonas sp. CMM02 TaxID=2769307 RepID=UPI0017803F59|nr:hypothetical protein [Comamonas sp. CMM02]MBD9402347.1 hypothetical protein [Comamonas sp. CMM02]